MQTAALEALEMCRRGPDRDNVIGSVWRGERRETWREDAANSNAACGFQMCQFPVKMQRCDEHEWTRSLTSHPVSKVNQPIRRIHCNAVTNQVVLKKPTSICGIFVSVTFSLDCTTKHADKH